MVVRERQKTKPFSESVVIKEQLQRSHFDRNNINYIILVFVL